MKKILSFMLVCIIGLYATEIKVTELQIPILSRHYDKNLNRIQGLNERNIGLLVNIKPLKNSNTEIKVGSYINSSDKQVLLVGIEEGYRRGFIRVGGSINLATGYDNPIVGGAFMEIIHNAKFGLRLDVSYALDKEIITGALSYIVRF